MYYKSTRGISPSVTFQQALLSGFAPDGGLYLPETIPEFSREEIKSWAKFSYQDHLLCIISKFISSDEITADELKGTFLTLNFFAQHDHTCDDIFEGCYSTFDDSNDIIPLRTVGVVKVAEMWHGPTGAFKDIALPAVG